MTDATTLEVLYTCERCRLFAAPVVVRVREPGEDVVAWVRDIVVSSIALDHRKRSRYCCATQITRIFIPLPPGQTKIGGPVLQ